MTTKTDHAELLTFLDAMRDNHNNTADLFAAGQIEAALDASGVRLTAAQRALAIETLESTAPEELAGVTDILSLPEHNKRVVN
ncbi:MAG TPA: hypothetical protein VFN67_11425 [Polyangiales bacterium]|nr:hypothetical protein [Polyangiales bacterium]